MNSLILLFSKRARLFFNLQTWVEHDYDTRLLHSNLAFPPLKKLTEAGDPAARRAFKCEIAKRYESGYPLVVEFLRMEGYPDYLSEDEFNAIEKKKLKNSLLFVRML